MTHPPFRPPTAADRACPPERADGRESTVDTGVEKHPSSPVPVDLTSLHESLARVVLVGRQRSAVFGELVGIARRAVSGSGAASITLIRGRKAFTAAHDGQLAIDADELQYQREHGPCLDAGRAAQVFVVDDMRTERRWPDYAAYAARIGVGSSLSIPLPFQSGTIGALNLYSARTAAFCPAEVELSEHIAGWVAMAVGNADLAARAAEEVENMRVAMLSRAVIDQAKGILMERHRLTEDAAFALLSRASQRKNTKLRDVAEHLVRTGELIS